MARGSTQWRRWMSSGVSALEPTLSTGKSGERKPATSGVREKLTFVSHAGEEKHFVRDLLKQIEKANVAAFFDDDMPVGTSAGNEMVTRAEEADQAVVVLSRSFLTKKWPMKELNIFIEKQVKIYPLYYQITPDELDDIFAIYYSQAGDDEDDACRLKMEGDPTMWRTLMNEIAPCTGSPGSRDLPDPRSWRDNLRELRKLTGLRRKDFGDDEAHYMKAIARMVSPPGLPDGVVSLPEQFIRPPVVDAVILALQGSVSMEVASHVVLTGMGGVGKTLVASAVARDKSIRRFFSDGVLWIKDRPGDSSAERLLLQLDALARQFEEIVLARHHRQGNTAQQFVDKFDNAQRAQNFFRMWQAKRNLKCLLVVDSAWNRRILQAAYAMGFSVLATVRNSAVVPDDQRWCSIPVLPMGKDDSLVVLKKYSRAPDDVPREWALQVAKDCAFLPQALAIAASTPTVVDAPMSTEAWRDLHARLVDTAGMKHTTTGQGGPLDAILGVSYEEMGRRQRSHFLKLAVLPNGVSAPLNMLGQLWDEDLADARVAVRDLVARSLMSIHGDEYLVHDLLLDYAKASIDKALAKDAAVRQAQHLSSPKVLDKYSCRGEHADGGFYSLVGLWGSVVKLDGLLAPKDFYLENLAAVTQSQGWMHAAHVLRLMGDYEGGAAVLKGLMGLLKEGARLESEESMTALTYLGFMNKMLGNFDEAATQFRQMLDLCIKGGVRVSYDAFSVLASTLTGQGKFDEAREVFNALVQAMEKHGRLHDPVHLRTLDNLGDLLVEQGKLDEAGLVFDRVVSTLKESIGEQHPDYASALHNRASVYSQKGDLPEAVNVYHRALVIRTGVLGRSHPDTLRTLANLASAFGAQEKYGEANAIFEQVTESIQKTTEIDDLELAYALHLWALTLAAQTKHAEAESMMARAVSIWEAHYRGDHRLLFRGIVMKAKLMLNQKKITAAAQLFQEACDMSERLFEDGGSVAAQCRQCLEEIRELQDDPDVDKSMLSTNHPDIDDHLPRRAVSLIEEGVLDEALALYQQWFANAPTHLGSKHLVVVQKLAERGQTLAEKGDYDNAEPLYRLGVRIADDVFAGRGDDGSTEDGILTVRMNWAFMLVAKRMCGEAEPVIRKCLENGKDILEPVVLALLISNLGVTLWGQGCSQKSIDTFSEAIKARAMALGTGHPDTVKLIHHVYGLIKKQKQLRRAMNVHHSASSLLGQGKVSDADALFSRAEEMLSSSVQEEHPNYAAVLWNHAAVLHAQDKRSEAESLLELAVRTLQKALNPHHRMVVSAQQALTSIHEERHEEVGALLRRCQCSTGEQACDDGSFPRTPEEETPGNDSNTLEDDYEEFTTALVLLPAPENSDMRARVLGSRALNLLRQQKFEACVADCNEALELDQSNGKAFHLRAHAKRARGELSDALEDATRALELDPENEGIQALVASLTTATTAN